MPAPSPDAMPGQNHFGDGFDPGTFIEEFAQRAKGGFEPEGSLEIQATMDLRWALGALANRAGRGVDESLADLIDLTIGDREHAAGNPDAAEQVYRTNRADERLALLYALQAKRLQNQPPQPHQPEATPALERGASHTIATYLHRLRDGFESHTK